MLIAVLIVSLIVIGSCVLSANASTDSYIRGDADNDGSITILDATTIQRYLASFTVSSFNMDAACITGTVLSILDATAIQRYLVGYINSYHIGEVINTLQPSRDEYELPFVPG